MNQNSTGDAPHLARQYDRWMVCIAHKEKDDKIMTSYILMDRAKRRGELVGLIWKEGEVWTNGKTLMKKMKEFCKPSNNYMKYSRKLNNTRH